MSETCMLVEDTALASSSAPATDVIMVVVSAGSATSSVQPTPQVVASSSANATSTVQVEAYTIGIGTANAVSSVSPSLVVADLISSAARASSSALQTLTQIVTSMANAEDSIVAADAPMILTSAAQAVSSVEAGSEVVMYLGDVADAKSSLTLGLLEAVTSSAAATASISILRRVDVTVTSAANGTSTTVESGEPSLYLLVSVGDAASVTYLQTETNMFVVAEATASSTVWFKDPTLATWVMNTESTAVSWYNNFDFESITQHKGRVFAAGADGLYEIKKGADTDDGSPINASVESGFTDFGSGQTKRLDNMYFGYTTAGQLALKTEAYESGTPPVTYLLEQRAATAPRNTRVTPGKGLWGRYWRLTFSNVEGADFGVTDASVDIAVSTRRI